MSSGKSTRFFYIFILVLVVGGVFLFLDKLGVLEIGLLGSSNPLITPEELCELLEMDEDNRAGIMKEKDYEETVDTSLQAIFYAKSTFNSNDTRIWIKFFTNEYSSKAFWLTFKQKKNYEKFVNYVAKRYKNSFKQDECLELSQECFLCNKGYTRGGKGYQILIKNRAVQYK